MKLKQEKSSKAPKSPKSKSGPMATSMDVDKDNKKGQDWKLKRSWH